jgi:hypothetical protein
MTTLRVQRQFAAKYPFGVNTLEPMAVGPTSSTEFEARNAVLRVASANMP